MAGRAAAVPAALVLCAVFVRGGPADSTIHGGFLHSLGLAEGQSSHHGAGRAVIAAMRANRSHASPNTCSIYHYASALELCQAEHPSRNAWELLLQDGRHHSLWGGGEESPRPESGWCKEEWYYRGEKRRGCLHEPLAADSSEPTSSRPWCVVDEGAPHAYVGAWGPWQYCDGASHTAAAQPHSWVSEPQASFAAESAPDFDALCVGRHGRRATCTAAMGDVLRSCQGTRDPVMARLSTLLEDTSCDVAPSDFASPDVKIAEGRCPAGYRMPNSRQECVDVWQVGSQGQLADCSYLPGAADAPRCFFRTDSDSVCWNELGAGETFWRNTLLLCGKTGAPDAHGRNESRRIPPAGAAEPATKNYTFHLRLAVKEDVWGLLARPGATIGSNDLWLNKVAENAVVAKEEVRFNTLTHMQSVTPNSTVEVPESCTPQAVKPHCSWGGPLSCRAPIEHGPSYSYDICHVSAATAGLGCECCATLTADRCCEQEDEYTCTKACGFVSRQRGQRVRPVWCEAFTPDCGGFVRGDAASCGAGCAHTPAHTAPETIHTQKFSKGVAPAVQEKQFRAARRTLSVAVMLLSLTGDELANVNVMTNSYLSTDAQGRVVSAEANKTVLNFK